MLNMWLDIWVKEKSEKITRIFKKYAETNIETRIRKIYGC